MSLKEEVLAIEKLLWSGGPDDYRAHLDEDCLVAFVGHVGVSSREDVAGTVRDGPRWQDVEMELEGLLHPTPDVAMLTYRASAARGDDERYRALVSSGYVKRDGDWKLMFHHQAPLPD